MAEHKVQVIDITICFYTVTYQTFNINICVARVYIVPLSIYFNCVPVMVRFKRILFFSVESNICIVSNSYPVIGGIYSFFFSNLIGKQITKAVFTSAILCAVVYFLEYFGFLVIAISADSLAAYIPLALVSLFLWFFIGFFL